MWIRTLTAAIFVLSWSPASAQVMSTDRALEFIAGKWWRFSCPPLGLVGQGRVNRDGSGQAQVRKVSEGRSGFINAATATAVWLLTGNSEQLVSFSQGRITLKNGEVCLGLCVGVTLRMREDKQYFHARSNYDPRDYCEFWNIPGSRASKK